jgi:hypothetical protein
LRDIETRLRDQPGKLDRWNTRYWDVERHLDRMKGKRNEGSYRGKATKRADRRERDVERNLERISSMRATSTNMGKPTRRALRIARLEAKAERLNALMWHPSNLPPSLARSVLQGFDIEAELGWKRKA